MQLIEDIKKAFGLTDDKEVAELLKKDKSTVSKWRTSGEIPAKAEKELKKILSDRLQSVQEDGQLLRRKSDRPSEAFDVPTPIGRIPIISWAQAGTDGFFEDSYEVGAGFGEINRPYDVTDPNAYALIVKGDSMVPRYDPGDILLVSPNAGAQVGDDAVVKLQDGTIMVKKVAKKNSHYIFESFNSVHAPIECAAEDVVFVHRVVWAKR